MQLPSRIIHAAVIWLFFSTVLTQKAQAQLADYQSMILDTTYTFAEIVNQAEQYFDVVGRGQHTGYKQFKRWEYHARRSLNPRGKVRHPGSIFEEYTNWNGSTPRNKRAVSNPWNSLGPESAVNTSTWSSHLGRITALDVDVNNDNHILVSSPGGGVWKSLDEGMNWVSVFDDQAFLDVYAVAISPHHSAHYYCGAYGAGLMRSVDGGGSWYTTNGISPYELIYTILMDPVDPDIALASTSWGRIYRTADGGDHWTLRYDHTAQMYDLEFRPGNPDVVYASGRGIVLRSTDRGQNFFPLAGPWSDGPMMMAVTPADANYLYVLESDQGGFGALYRSTNGGSTFTTRSDDAAGTNNIMGYDLDEKGGQAPRDMDVVVSPVDRNEVHVAGIMTFRSYDGGLNWTQTTHWVVYNPLPFIHADVDMMLYRGQKIYFGTDGGFFFSSDKANTIVDRSQGLDIRQFYRIGTSNTSYRRVSGGSQDNGTGVLRQGVWYDFMGADGMETFISKFDPDLIFGSVQFGSLYFSTDGGNNLYYATQVPGRGDWVTPLEQDPLDPLTLYQAKQQLYKSNDMGDTWTAISNVVTDVVGDTIAVEMAVAPTDNDRIYLAFRRKLFLTADGGNTWDDVTPNVSFSNINYISIHPTDPLKALLCLIGASEPLQETTNGGNTWNNITGNLPVFSLNCAVYEGGGTDGIFAGMNPGVYYRETSTSGWESFNQNLPEVNVQELEISNGELYAATYGRGLWVAQLSPCLLMCTNTADTGPGSLRAAIECANSGDVIVFDASLNNQTIELAAPAIMVNKEIKLKAPTGSTIMISNADVGNSEVLIRIQDPLQVEGVMLEGKSAESFIMKLESNGSLEIIDGAMDRISVEHTGF